MIYAGEVPKSGNAAVKEHAGRSWDDDARTVLTVLSFTEHLLLIFRTPFLLDETVSVTNPKNPPWETVLVLTVVEEAEVVVVAPR